MKSKYFITAAIIVLMSQSIFGATSVQAAADFPSCPTPGGQLISQYSSGTHGIPGDSSSYVGSDAVYQVSATQAVQCFCPEVGVSGMQTNWLMLQDPSESEINAYKAQGWVFVPDGSLWGLQAANYVAKNISISCAGGSSTTSSGSSSNSSSSGPSICDSAKPSAPILYSVKRNGSTATLTWSTVQYATHYTISYGTKPGTFTYGVPNTGNVTQFTVGSLDPNATYYWEVRAVNNCAPSEPSSSTARGGGDVLGENTGFAPTGNVSILMLFAGIGMILLGMSIAFKNRREVRE